jgi:Holliday junction resolvase RusA-like endonuclease
VSQWLLEFPAPTDWITSNQRSRHLWQTKDRQTWTAATLVWAKAQKLPKNLNKVHVTATLSFPDNRRRDVGNYGLTIKVCIDALVRYGLIPDDRDRHLIGPDLRVGAKTTTGLGWLRLDIQEVT